MKRIRLQIQVIPWQTGPPSHSSEVKPWVQPENPDCTLQQLVDNIVTRYGRIYVGRGPLRIKELQDYWGSTLDLSDKISDIFDDRAASGENLTSICKVLRYPPDEAELINRNRFASLLPESAARPQKRPPPPLFHETERPLPSVEHDNAFETREAKRRRVESPQALRSPVTMSGEIDPESSQTSVIQVIDSQANRHKELPPRPSSAMLQNSPRQHNATNNVAILDSPARRHGPKSVTQRSSRSASLEIPLPFKAHLPITRPRSPTPDQANVDMIQSLPEADEIEETAAAQDNTNAARREVSSGPDHERLHVRNGSGRRRSSGAEIYDDIESDTESLLERQTMFDARSHRTASKTPLRTALPTTASLRKSGSELTSAASSNHRKSLKPNASTDSRNHETQSTIRNRSELSQEPDRGLPLQASAATQLNRDREHNVDHLSVIENETSKVNDVINDVPVSALSTAHRLNESDSTENHLSLHGGHEQERLHDEGHHEKVRNRAISPTERSRNKSSSPSRLDETNGGDSIETESDASGPATSSQQRHFQSAAHRHSLGQTRKGMSRESSVEILPALSKQAKENEKPKSHARRGVVSTDHDEDARREQKLTEEANKGMLEAEGIRELQAGQAKLSKHTAQAKTNEAKKRTATQRQITPTPAPKRRERPPKNRDVETSPQAPSNINYQEKHTGYLPPATAKVGGPKKGYLSQLIAEKNPRASSKNQGASSIKSETPSTASREKRTITPIWPGRREPNRRNSLGEPSVSRGSEHSVDLLPQHATKGISRQLSRPESAAIKSGHPTLGTPHAQTNHRTRRVAAEVNGAVGETQNKRLGDKNGAQRKKQSTLNVTRDRKLKGRASNHDLSPANVDEQSMMEVVDVDDDDVSSYFEEEDKGWGIAKAGPSNKTNGASRGPGVRQSENRATLNVDPSLQASRSPLAVGSDQNSTHASKPGQTSLTRRNPTHYKAKQQNQSTAGTISEPDSQVDPKLIQISPEKSSANQVKALSRQQASSLSRDYSTSSTASSTSATSAANPKPANTTTTTSTRPTSLTPSKSFSPLADSPTAVLAQPSQHSPLFLTQQNLTQLPSQNPASPTLETRSTSQQRVKPPSRPKANKYPSLSALARDARGQPPAPTNSKRTAQSKRTEPSPFADSDDDDASDSDSSSASSSSSSSLQQSKAGSNAIPKTGNTGASKLLAKGLRGVMKSMFLSSQ